MKQRCPCDCYSSVIVRVPSCPSHITVHLQALHLTITVVGSKSSRGHEADAKQLIVRLRKEKHVTVDLVEHSCVSIRRQACLCCSSTMATPRALKTTPSPISACVPTRMFTVPSLTSLKIACVHLHHLNHPATPPPPVLVQSVPSVCALMISGVQCATNRSLGSKSPQSAGIPAPRHDAPMYFFWWPLLPTLFFI